MKTIWLVIALMMVAACGSQSGGSGGELATTVSSGSGGDATTGSGGAPTTETCEPIDDGNDCTEDGAIAGEACELTHVAIDGGPCADGGTCWHGTCVTGEMVGAGFPGCAVVEIYSAASFEVGDHAAQFIGPFDTDTLIEGLWSIIPPAGDCDLSDRTMRVSVPTAVSDSPNGVGAYLEVELVNIAVLPTTPNDQVRYAVGELSATLFAPAGTGVWVSQAVTETACASACSDVPSPAPSGHWCTEPSEAALSGCGSMAGAYPGVGKAQPWAHGVVTQ